MQHWIHENCFNPGEIIMTAIAVVIIVVAIMVIQDWLSVATHDSQTKMQRCLLQWKITRHFADGNRPLFHTWRFPRPATVRQWTIEEEKFTYRRSRTFPLWRKIQQLLPPRSSNLNPTHQCQYLKMHVRLISQNKSEVLLIFSINNTIIFYALIIGEKSIFNMYAFIIDNLFSILTAT